MYAKRLLNCAVIGVMVLGSGASASAAEPGPYKISVSGLHCPACAKKVSTTLGAVPQVSQVQTDFPSGTFTVTARPQRLPSQRALWEAVEKAGYNPTRLVGPGGSFTTKPRT